jgi:peptidoglycan/LPS O-acetylase OafA/YrhL
MFTGLNGLRFIAALTIVFYHYAPLIEGYQRLPDVVRNLISEGPAAVGFFFILSGFVLAHRYLSAGASVGEVGAFYWSRFTRIYPAYLIGFVLFVPLAFDKYVIHPPFGVSNGKTLVVSALLYSFMLQAWTPLSQAWNGPSWSLSVEAFMYLIFPLAGAQMVRLSNRKTLVLVLIAWVLPVAVVCSYQAGLISGSTWEGYLRNSPLLWTSLFVMGIAAARFIGPWKKVSTKAASRLSIGVVIAVIVIAAVWPRTWIEVFVAGGIAPLFAAVIVFFTRDVNRLTHIIAGNTLNRLGQASYAMYIIQAPIWHYWQATTNLMRQSPAQTNTVAAWQFVVFVPVLVFISLAVERLVEIPGRRWLSRIPKASMSLAAVQAAKARVATQGTGQ